MRLIDYLKAGYPCLWVQTHEDERAIANLSKEAEANGYETAQWDIVSGMIDLKTRQIQSMSDPVQPLKAMFGIKPMTVVFLKDFHKFIGNVEVFRTFKNVLSARELPRPYGWGFLVR